MFRRAAEGLEIALPVAVAALLVLRLAVAWAARVPYPYDLEWMEGGMLAHAWRLAHGLPLYVEPGPDFVPYVYPPGYSALVAALGEVVGLHPALGRLVSVVGTLAGAGAVGAIVQRHGGSARIGFCAAVAFLGAWPASGAFYDLVRPDGLLVGLALWSIALALDGRRGTVVASALLLAVAFLVKHNAAALGVPIALALLVRDGWRSALGFALVSGGPALAMVGVLQARTDGRFLDYLVGVPTSHPSEWGRVWPDTLREVGTPLPFVLGVPVTWALLRAFEGRSTPRALAAFAPMAAGMLAGWWGTYVPPLPEWGVYNVPSSVAFFAVAAVPVALLLWLGGRLADGVRPLLSWREVAALGLVATTFAVSCVMRAHNGGFLNVHVPLFAVAAVAFGLVLCRWAQGVGGRILVTGLLVAQGLWGHGLLREERLVPTEADRAAGARIVERIRAAEGPVLSPFASWLPVYAGREPSLHRIAVWDLEYPESPFRTDAIRQAVAERHWAMILAARNRDFPYELPEHYAEAEVLLEGKDRAFAPKSGWDARPFRLLVPKD